MDRRQGKSGETQRFEVLLEQVHADVRTVAEGHTLLAKQLETTRAGLEQRLTFLEHAVLEGFDGLRTQIRGLTERFDVHERAHRGGV